MWLGLLLAVSALEQQARADFDAGRLEQALSGYDAAVAEARAARGPDLDALLGQQRLAAGMLGTARLKERRAPDALPLYQKALAISRERGDKDGELFDLESVGYCFRALGKPKDAVASYEEARKLAASRSQPEQEAVALDGLVQTSLDFENLPLASKYLEESLALNTARADHERAVSALLALLWVWPENKPFWDLAPLIVKARAAVNATKDAPLQVSFAYFDFLLSAGLLSEVNSMLTRTTLEQELTPLLKAQRLSMLAKIADARGDFVNAEATHRAVILEYTNSKNRSGAAGATARLAEHFRLAGQYGPALQQCEAAIAQFKEEGSRLGMGRGWLCKAQVLAALGKRKDADEASGQAAKLGKAVGSKSLMAASLAAAAAGFRAPTTPGVVLEGPAREKFREDQLPSLSASKSALSFYAEAYDGLAIGREAVLSAPTFLAMGEPDAASTLAGVAVEAGQKLGDRQLEANALRVQAEVALARHDAAAARKLSGQALAIAEELGDGENAARTWDILARLEAQQGRAAGAILFRKQAVNAVQALRGSAANLSRELRASQTKSREDVYRDLAGDLLREGRLAEAEQALAMLKEQEFAQFVRARQKDAVRLDATPAEAAWVQRSDANRERLARLGQEVRAVKPSTSLFPPSMIAQLFAGLLPADAAERAAALEPQLAAARRELDELLGSAQLADAARDSRPGLLQSKLSRLGEGAVALHYVLQGSVLHILLATPQKAVHREMAAAQLAVLVPQFRELLQIPSRDPRPAGRALYDLLLAPVAQDLREAGARTLLLALDGSLRYVPFAALWDGEQYVAQRYRLGVYTPAAAASIDRPPRKSWTIAALGVSLGAPGFEPLPAVPGELSDIVQKILPGKLLLDKAFTRAALADALKQKPAVLHLASHFAFDPDGTDAESFLLLGSGATLSLADFSGSEFPVDQLDLLTLSACQTGVGSTGREGVEVEGFGVLAQRKGAAAVLATLWPVADATTSLFMREFYRRRETQHLPKAEALRATQLGFITGEYNAASLGAVTTRGFKRAAQSTVEAPPFVPDVKAPYSHPLYWAPFILMGNSL